MPNNFLGVMPYLMSLFAAMNYFRRALRFTSSELCVQIHALSYSLDVKLLSLY
jgi:hypothetical protein